jgi:HEAT repeat protein
MSAARKGLLQRIFNIYPGEERQALLFAFLGFIWAFGATCGLKFADALFLLHVGAESLPQAYTLISCGMFGLAFVLLYSFHKFSSYHIYLTTLLSGLGFYSFIFICLLLDIGTTSQWLWYALKLVGFYLFAVLMTCYWTFIDQYHHLQDAKRLYSLFSSTIFLGAASTGLLMYSGLLDLDHLMILIIGLLCLTYFWVGKIAHAIPLVAHEDIEQEGQVYEDGSYLKFFIKSITSSRFTLLLMTSNLLIYLLLVITEYNYMFTFENHFANQLDSNAGGGTEASLTLFLGQCLATVSVSNLFFGLFIYSRMVRRFGISSLLLITPILLIIAFTGWSVSNSLLFPLLGFFVVEGTSYIIDDNNFNLLLNAVPTKLKYKIRVIIESFFEPVGMLTSATLLSFFQNHSKLLGLILAICTLCIGLALSANYLKALFFNLSENAVHFQRTVTDWISKMTDKQQKAAESRLLGIFKLGDEQAQLFACEGLLAFEDATILKRLLNHASHMRAKTKIKLVPLFEQSIFAKNSLVLDALQEWVQQDFDPQLRSTVYFYLAKQGLLHPEKIRGELKNSDLQLQGAAIIALKKSLAYLPPTTAAYNRTLAAHHLKLLLDSHHEEELCMGLQILGIDGDMHNLDILISYLKHPSLMVARTAAKSIAKAESLDSIRQAPLIISQLSQISDNEVRLSCLKALEQVNDSSLVDDIIQISLHFRPNERRLTEEVIFKMGLRTVPALLSIMRDTQAPDRCRLLAGRILGRLALPQLRANLSDIIRQEIERAYFYFYHHHTIQSLNPELDLSMLQDVLITGHHSVLDFIIQILGIAGEVEDEELLSRSLRSRNSKVRSQVVETLEKTCEPQIFRLLQPLVDDIPYEEKIRICAKSGNKPLILNDLLDKMSESSAQIDRIIAATMKYHLNLPYWRESLRQQMSRQNEIFHHFAYELLDS